MSNYGQTADTARECIHLAGIDWNTLAIERGCRLLLAKEVVSIQPFDSDFTNEVWETSSLRRYLNTKFLKMFKSDEKTKLVKKRLVTHKNPVYETYGGNDTYDYVFVLSFNELERYIAPVKLPMFNAFSDASVSSNEEQHNEPLDINFYNDFNNPLRIAFYKNDPVCWWLRTMGAHNNATIAVLSDGGICLAGLDASAIMDVGGVGVRPAIWIKEI